MVAQRVWPNARVTITRPDGGVSTHDKARLVAGIAGEPARIFASDGTVLAELDADHENEVSNRLVTYHHASGEHWSVQEITGGCGCGQ